MDRKTLRQSPRPGVALLLALCGLTTAGARPAAAATASDWTASFKPALLETYVQGSGGRVMVVRVGDVSRRQPEAARALADALTQAPSVKKVIPDDVLGGPPPQDDIEVVRRATKFSLDRVFLVRVSSADRGRPPSAIASIYSGSGELVAGFTVDAGVEVRPFVPAATRSAGQGAGTETVEAVTRVMAGDDSPAVEEYLQSFVGVLDPADGNVLYTSKYMRVLEISAFLDHVGRKDLAERQRRNETWRTGLRWGGHLVFGRA